MHGSGTLDASDGLLSLIHRAVECVADSDSCRELLSLGFGRSRRLVGESSAKLTNLGAWKRRSLIYRTKDGVEVRGGEL